MVTNLSETRLAIYQKLTRFNMSVKFDEMSEVKICKYYQYKRPEERYIGKEGKRIEYIKTTRTDHSEPVNKIVAKLSEAGDKYIKHRPYVDICNAVFTLMKETYIEKFVELDFSQNISVRPKDEIQLT